MSVGVLGSSSGSSASTTDSLWQSSPGSCDVGGQSFPSGRSPTLAPSSSWSKRFASRFLACSGISGAEPGHPVPHPLMLRAEPKCTPSVMLSNLHAGHLVSM